MLQKPQDLWRAVGIVFQVIRDTRCPALQTDFRTCGNNQHIGPDRHRLRGFRRFGQDRMGIRPANAETADSGAPGCRQPRPCGGGDLDHLVVQPQFGVRCLEMQVRGIDLQAHRQRRADQPDQPSRSPHMADLAFDRAQDQRRRPVAIDGMNRADLHRVAEDRACAVRFDIAHVIRRQPALCQRCRQRRPLAGGRGRGVAHLVLAIVVDRGTFQHRMNAVAVAQGGLQRL